MPILPEEFLRIFFDDTPQALLRRRPLVEEVQVAHHQHLRERLTLQPQPLRGACDAAPFQLQGLLDEPRLQLVHGAVEAEVPVVQLHPRQALDDQERARAEPLEVFGVLRAFQEFVGALVEP